MDLAELAAGVPLVEVHEEVPTDAVGEPAVDEEPEPPARPASVSPFSDTLPAEPVVARPAAVPTVAFVAAEPSGGEQEQAGDDPQDADDA